MTGGKTKLLKNVKICVRWCFDDGRGFYCQSWKTKYKKTKDVTDQRACSGFLISSTQWKCCILTDMLWIVYQLACSSRRSWRQICWNVSTVLMMSSMAIIGLSAHAGLKSGYALKLILDIEFRLKVSSLSFFSGAILPERWASRRKTIDLARCVNFTTSLRQLRTLHQLMKTYSCHGYYHKWTARWDYLLSRLCPTWRTQLPIISNVMNSFDVSRGSQVSREHGEPEWILIKIFGCFQKLRTQCAHLLTPFEIYTEQNKDN